MKKILSIVLIGLLIPQVKGLLLEKKPSIQDVRIQQENARKQTMLNDYNSFLTKNNVSVKPLPKELEGKTQGQYIDSKRQILISKNAPDFNGTFIHEGTHAIQSITGNVPAKTSMKDPFFRASIEFVNDSRYNQKVMNLYKDKNVSSDYNRSLATEPFAMYQSNKFKGNSSQKPKPLFDNIIQNALGMGKKK